MNYSDIEIAEHRRLRNNWILKIGILCVILLAVPAILIDFNVPTPFAVTPGSDSGVQACQQMADNTKKPKTGEDKHMTEADYHKTRKPFEDSKHADIKVAGTNLVDTIYKMDQKSTDDASFGDAFAMLSTIQTQWAALQTACANHGVDLPALTS